MMQPLSGKYGVGVKSTWTKEGCHVLIFYPVQKALYEAAMKVKTNKALW
jgi:hypothetical protein